jgi:hypothetical protein
MRLALAVCLFLVASTIHAQDLPLKPESQKTGDLLTSNTEIPPVEEGAYSNTPIPTEMFSEMITRPLPAKPQPIAFEGEWISASEPWPKFPDDLVVTERKDDGKWFWHVEKVNSCAWCGAPMTWKKAMFDKKGSSMWALRSALMVADIEISHRAPCFRAGTCREGNPLLGQTRLQGYSVAAGLTAFAWIGDAWMRKGNSKYRVGGYKDWWFVPLLGDMTSAFGIFSNLATWKDR